MPAAFPLYRSALLIAFPLGIALHGLVWVTMGHSYAPAIYAMKLVFLPFLLVALLTTWRDLFSCRRFWVYCASCAPLFVGSLLAPIALDTAINRFYYVTDFAGIGVTLSAVAISYVLLRRGDMGIADLERISAIYLVIISIYIMFYFVLSGGGKVSVNPEMSFPMALVVGAYLVPTSDGYQPPFWIILLTALACAVSQLRENLALFVLLAAICIVRGAFYDINWRNVALYILSAVFVLLVTPDLIADRIQTIEFGRGSAPSFGGASANPFQVSFADASAKQRMVEVRLMYEEMLLRPWSFVFGQGFGATYLNEGGVLVFYGERVHNAHSTPFVVYFRNGLYGLLLYAVPISIAASSIFRRNEIVFRASLCVVAVYAALMGNQYLYWSVPIGVSIALLFVECSARQKKRH